MIEYALLGTIQGVAEWLPVSSEGLIVLFSSYVFPGFSLSEAVHLALFLHLGTFLAALVYLFDDVVGLCKSITNFKKAEAATQKELVFLAGATGITAIVGFPLLTLINETSTLLSTSTFTIGLIVGTLLIVTGGLHLAYQSTAGERTSEDLTTTDALLTGIFQGMAGLPGLSRSGLTVAAMLMRGIKDQDALRYSFLLSLPVVLGGNIILNADTLASPGVNEIVALLFSFVFGLLTIHALLKVARHISWGTFTIAAGVLLILGAII